MGYMRYNFRSQVLCRYVDVSITYPSDHYAFYDMVNDKKGLHDEVGEPKPMLKPGMKFQTIYLIHGGGDDDTLAMRYSMAEVYAEQNNVMLVCPNLTNSFGVDTEYDVKYQTFLTEELPVVVQTLFASSPKREDNFIMGFAMGGNVALGTALMHPDKFAACVDISGGIGMTLCSETIKAELKQEHFKKYFPIYLSTFGDPDKFDGSRFDIYSIAKKNKEAGIELPKFYICCGENEFIRERVEGDVAAMKELGYDIEYICAPGHVHDFRMFNEYMIKAMNELLPLKRYE